MFALIRFEIRKIVAQRRSWVGFLTIVLINALFALGFYMRDRKAGATQVHGLRDHLVREFINAFAYTQAILSPCMFLLFPMKAKTMVMIFIGIELLMSVGPNTGVATIAHLGGAAFGYLYLKRRLPALRLSLPDVDGAYRRWKMQRAKKKFEVYLRNRSGRGPWVN